MTQRGQMTTDSLQGYALDDNKTLCKNSEIKSVIIRNISVICVPKNIH